MAPILDPQHTPIPSPLDELGLPHPVIMALVLAAILDLCPLSTPIADPPHEAQPDLSRVGRGAITYYTSGRDEAHIPMPFNQLEWPVPRPRRALHTSQMMSTTSEALLFRADNA